MYAAVGKVNKGEGRREEELEEQAVKEAGKALGNEIRNAKRRTWEEFLHKADGNNIWSVMTYTKSQRGSVVPTISHNGVTANMLIDSSFQAPIEYGGDEGDPGPPGQAFRMVESRLVAMAFMGTSTKKARAPTASAHWR